MSITKLTATVLIAIGAALSMPAAAEWIPYAYSTENETVFYYKPDTVKRDGTLRRVWTLERLKQRDPGGALSNRALEEFECKGERTRILSLTTFSEPGATGKILQNITIPNNSDWRYVAPDTVGSQLLKLVCR